MARIVLMLVVSGMAAACAACLGPVGTSASPIAIPAARDADVPAAMRDLLDYLGDHGSTGFVVIQGGRVLIDETWPPPGDDPLFASFLYGRAEDGALFEDVASQQKSFVAVLVAIAIDKGLLDPEAPVSTYLGPGWSKAAADQEAAIRVVDLLTMSSGLDEAFDYVAPRGTVFFYNTPVYAVLKPILEAAAGRSLDEITRDWLTAPLGMNDTDWRTRPAALASVGNATGLVTTPQDVARFGLMILSGGVADDGTRIVSVDQMSALFARSSTNPAYGRLWWLNGSDHTVRAPAGRVDGPLIPAAPSDLVGAFGAFDRRLYVVPGRRLVVVRTGAAAGDRDFDQQLWLRLNRVLN